MSDMSEITSSEDEHQHIPGEFQLTEDLPGGEASVALHTSDLQPTATGMHNHPGKLMPPRMLLVGSHTRARNSTDNSNKSNRSRRTGPRFLNNALLLHHQNPTFGSIHLVHHQSPTLGPVHLFVQLSLRSYSLHLLAQTVTIHLRCRVSNLILLLCRLLIVLPGRK